MTCKEVILQFLMDYVARALPPEVETKFEHHIAQCQSCVSYLKSYQETIRLGQGALSAPDDVEAEVPEELVQAVLTLRR